LRKAFTDDATLRAMQNKKFVSVNEAAVIRMKGTAECNRDHAKIDGHNL
jgi:hypothetical protein